jgi:hypothetical protein
LWFTTAFPSTVAVIEDVAKGMVRFVQFAKPTKKIKEDAPSLALKDGN